MKLRIKNTDLTLKIIAWLQIVGGTTGIGLVAYLMLQTGDINGALLLIFLLGLALFIFSIYSGKELLSKNDINTALILSIVNQAFQFFQWKLFGYGLAYSSGAEITLGVQDLTFKFNFSALISSFAMSIDTTGEYFIKINLVAILVAVVLFDIYRELNEATPDVSQDELQIPDQGAHQQNTMIN